MLTVAPAAVEEFVIFKTGGWEDCYIRILVMVWAEAGLVSLWLWKSR